jgi:hypothetical protein
MMVSLRNLLRNLLSFGCVSPVERDALLRGLWACCVFGALAASDAFAAQGSRIAEAQFRAANPCPVTGTSQGPCTGYVIDRVIPLVCGGADQPDNMRWITVAEAKAKAKWERIGCRPGRRLVLPHEMKSMTEAFALGDAGQPIQGRSLDAAGQTTVAPLEARAVDAPDARAADAPDATEDYEPHQ